MILFTKPGCRDCEMVKSINYPGIEIADVTDRDGLALLAWYELVSVAEKQLPILILEDDTAVVGLGDILAFLGKHRKEFDIPTGECATGECATGTCKL